VAKEQFILEGDAAAVVREYARVIEQNKQLKEQMREVRRAARSTRESFQGSHQVLSQLRSVAMSVAGAFGFGFGLAGLASKFAQSIKEAYENLDRMGQKAVETGRSMVAFAMMQRPGQVGQAVREIAALGARYGITPGEAWYVTQSFQAMPGVGTVERARRAVEPVFRLHALAGVPMETARAAVATGIGMGLTPEQAARAVYAAGRASQLSPVELAAAAGGALPAYKGLGGGAITGYGVMAALSTLVTEPGELGTMARQVGIALQRASGRVGKTWRALGIEQPGVSPIEQLDALYRAIQQEAERRGVQPQWMAELERRGFALKQSRGLAILLSMWPRARQTIEQVQALYRRPGILERERMAAEAEAPHLRLEREDAIMRAALEYAQQFGPSARRAMRRRYAQRAAALAAAQIAPERVPESGLLTWSSLVSGVRFSFRGERALRAWEAATEAYRKAEERFDAMFSAAANDLRAAADKLDAGAATLQVPGGE